MNTVASLTLQELLEIGNRARQAGDRAGALASYEAAAAADPQRPGVLFDIASVLRELGRLDEAEAALQRLLAIEPKHFGALIERGHVLRRRGNRVDALASYEEAAAADPQRPGVLVDIASVLRELGRLDEAEAALQRLLVAEPAHFGALIERGHVLRRRGNRVDALASYEAAAAADPQRPGVLFDIASVLRELGRLDEAEAALQRLLAIEPKHFGALIERGHVLRRRGNRVDALASYEEAAAADPQRPAVLVDIASVLRELGRLDEAEAALQRLLVAEPAHFGALIERGHVLRRRGNRVDALASYEAAAAADPQRPGVLFDIASVLRELGRLDEAEAALQRLLAIEPKHFGALIERGHVLRRRGNRVDALASYEEAAAADPQRPGVLVDIASVLRELGRLDEAEAALQRLLVAEPAHFGALIERGHVLRRRGNRVDALASYEAAAAADPQRPGVLFDIASVLRELGRLDEAEAALQRLLAAEPTNTRALLMSASLLMDAFKLDEAERCLNTAAEHLPNDVESQVQLGHLARRRGQRPEAFAHFIAANSINPTHVGARLEIAAELRDQGLFNEALGWVNKLINDDPTNFQARMHLGRLHRSAGDNKSAFDAFEKASELRPDDPDVLIEKASELRALGNPAASARLLHLALERNPNHVVALNLLAEHAWMAENFEESLALCRRAIEIQPQRVWSYIHASRAAAGLGQQQDALNFLSQGREKSGRHPEIEAAQAALFRRNRNYHAAKATLETLPANMRSHFSIWEQWTELAISTGHYETAEEALQNAPNSTPHERARACLLRGQLAEAQWQLERAVNHYKEALELNSTDSLTHNEMARLCLKLHDLENAYFHLQQRTALSASTRLLKGGNLNASQSHLGHLYDEYALDRSTLAELRAIQTHPYHQQIVRLLQLIRENPDYTPAALALLVALRRASHLKLPGAITPAATSLSIPLHIAQYWDASTPPTDIFDLMKSWQQINPSFSYTKFDKNSATTFLKANFPYDVWLAFSRAREPAQAADVFRLAYLYLKGGFYCDADDQCFASLLSFVPSNADFVGYLEGHGSLANNFLGVIPNHGVIKRSLELAVEAINRGDHDETWLSTGPGLLSRAFAQTLSAEKSYFGLLESTAIFDFNGLQRYIGFHCPAEYKRSTKHWKRALVSVRGKSG